MCPVPLALMGKKKAAMGAVLGGVPGALVGLSADKKRRKEAAATDPSVSVKPPVAKFG